MSATRSRQAVSAGVSGRRLSCRVFSTAWQGRHKRLQAVQVERILPRILVQRHDMIGLQAPGPAAQGATEAVALEYLPARRSPAPGVQAGVAAAHPAMPL